MSLMTRRHFVRIAEIAAKMDLDTAQFDVLVHHLHYTNHAFNENRFRTYYNDKRA